MACQTGRCLCGAVAYEFDEDAVIWQGHCHCETCRRACAAGIASWIGVQRSGWRWQGAAPMSFQSSPGRDRWFCGNCGTQFGYLTHKLPNEMHILAVTLDDPLWFKPQAHYFHKGAVSWLHVEDDLPRYVDGGKTLDITGG